MSSRYAVSPETEALSIYLAQSQHQRLPDDVKAKTAMHALDTLAAIISGSEMPAGRAGQAYVRSLDASSTATVIGTRLMTDVQNAALANGMAAHADETDDSHEPSLSHPGCAVVPAALAIAERCHVSGGALLRAIAAGYDVGTRIGMAIGHPESPLEGSSISTHAHVGCYAAAAATSSLLRHDPEQCRAVLSFASQSAAGTTAWARDPHHVEKAFVFAGMPAANGVRAGQLVDVGSLGVPDPFTSQPNAIDAYSERPDLAAIADGLGTRFEIMRTNIKKFAVGSPSQAPVQATLDLLAKEHCDPEAIEDVEIVLPHDLAPVVDARAMPNINVQYLVAGTIIDGRFSFAMAHDETRLAAGPAHDLMGRVRLISDANVTGVRQAEVTVTLRDGTRRRAFVGAVRGTAANPMSTQEVREKALDLIEPVIGASKADRLAELVLALDEQTDLGELFSLLAQGA